MLVLGNPLLNPLPQPHTAHAQGISLKTEAKDVYVQKAKEANEKQAVAAATLPVSRAFCEPQPSRVHMGEESSVCHDVKVMTEVGSEQSQEETSCVSRQFQNCEHQRSKYFFIFYVFGMRGFFQGGNLLSRVQESLRALGSFGGMPPLPLQCPSGNQDARRSGVCCEVASIC